MSAPAPEKQHMLLCYVMPPLPDTDYLEVQIETTRPHATLTVAIGASLIPSMLLPDGMGFVPCTTIYEWTDYSLIELPVDLGHTPEQSFPQVTMDFMDLGQGFLVMVRRRLIRLVRVSHLFPAV